MSENLSGIINKIFPLSEPSLLQLTNEITIHKHRKDDLLVKSGRPNELEYILLNGICRSFVYNPQGNEITLSFYMAGNPISPNITRVNNNGLSSVNIQALSDIEIASFPTSKLMEFMRTNRELNEWGNRVLQRELFQKVEKELALASMSGTERLNHFREKYATLENLIPHTFIATYLGITSVSLSRIRSKLSKK